jgi:RsiW-degrading membrane proteinase PrsW (M82 family)
MFFLLLYFYLQSAKKIEFIKWVVTLLVGIFTGLVSI